MAGFHLVWNLMAPVTSGAINLPFAALVSGSNTSQSNTNSAWELNVGTACTGRGIIASGVDLSIDQELRMYAKLSLSSDQVQYQSVQYERV